MLLRANPMCRRLTASLVIAGLAFLTLLGWARSASAVSESELAEQRANMVLTIQRDAIETVGWTGKTSFDPKVIDAMARVPRHRFVPDDLLHLAYENRPLPIGYGQTISQPYIVALMTDLLAVDEDDVVFELGTGSGYQAAVLAELAAQVYTVEIVPGLSDQAATRLASLHYNNVTVRAGDGYYGWEEHAPFDAIIVTAATDHVPPPLIAQLKPGGRMAIPVGSPFQTQILMLVEKTSEGKLITHQVLPVMFVPVTGPH
jgi:protein-L-isoaspartate(D-aspartate) O-methyltransferase